MRELDVVVGGYFRYSLFRNYDCVVKSCIKNASPKILCKNMATLNYLKYTYLFALKSLISIIIR